MKKSASFVDLLLGRTVQVALAVVLVITASMTANAADKLSYPAKFVGAWCLVENNDETGWSFYKRDKCDFDAGLVLKRNGDYVSSLDGHDEHCKADPKSYFKGWTKYTCIDHVGTTRKRTQKFAYDPSEHELGLGSVDND